MIKKNDKKWYGSVKRVMSDEYKVNLSEDIQKTLDIIDPINPVTGHRDGLIDRYMNQNLSQAERDAVAAYLKDMGKGAIRNLSDKELMEALPSRYLNSLVDFDRVRSWLGEQIEQKGAEEPQSSSEPASNEPSNTVE